MYIISSRKAGNQDHVPFLRTSSRNRNKQVKDRVATFCYADHPGQDERFNGSDMLSLQTLADQRSHAESIGKTA
jgi:hypothetical protein